MMFARRLLIAAPLLLTLTLAGAASAVPITFQLDNVTTVGASFPSTDTYVPGFPIVGSGDIDFGAGTGTLSLPNYSIFIDLAATGPGDDAQVDVTGWGQSISSIDGSGNITSTGSGSVGCTAFTGFGGFVCGATPLTVAGWPPPDGETGASSAVIDTGAQTITIIDNSIAAAGVITQSYSYSIIPEPGTALLLGGSLVGLGLIGRRRA
jgi:hypothetical protein